MRKNIQLTHRFQDVAFRQIEPIPQWSRRIRLHVPYEHFAHVMYSTAEQTQHRYTGTFERNPGTDNVTSFTHTRFRRNKHGKHPEVEECEEAMRLLAERFGVIPERELVLSGTSRIMLGLYEGQHASGARIKPEGPDYSLEDIEQALGEGYRVRPAEVFSIRLDNEGKASHYGEELASVVFPSELYKKAYLVGHAMVQERFSVETFAEPHGLSYMVETEWCQDPDPAHPATTL